jgi:hypothetical protein
MSMMAEILVDNTIMTRYNKTKIEKLSVRCTSQAEVSEDSLTLHHIEPVEYYCGELMLRFSACCA